MCAELDWRIGRTLTRVMLCLCFCCGNVCVFSAVQESAEDFGRFGQIMKLKAFYPFETAEAALDAINCLSEGFLFFYFFIVLVQWWCRVVSYFECELAAVPLTSPLPFAFVLVFPLS